MEPFFSPLCFFLRNRSTWLGYSVFGHLSTATLELDASAWICSIKQKAHFGLSFFRIHWHPPLRRIKRTSDYYSGSPASRLH